MRKLFWTEGQPTKLLLIATPLLFVIVNALLKYAHLASQSIAIDEPWSIYYAQFDVPAIIERLSNDNNPPLFEVILHYWIQLFGIEPQSVRFLPATFSIITVFWVYKIGYKFFSYKVAIIAATLFTLSNFNNYFAHDTRVYTLMHMLVVMNMYYFFSLIKEPKKKLYTILFFITQLLLMYAHFFGLFMIIVQVICVLFIKDIRKAIGKQFLLILGLSTLFYSPWIYVIVRRFLFLSATGNWIPPIENLQPIANVYKEAYNKTQINLLLLCIITAYTSWLFYKKAFKSKTVSMLLFANTCLVLYHMVSLVIGKIPTIPIPLTVQVLLLLPLVVIVFTKIIRSTNIVLEKKVLFLWLLFPTIITFTASLHTPMFINRYMIYISSALYILIATLILTKDFKAYILIAASLIVFLYTANYDINNGRQIKEMVAKVKALENDDTVILIYPEWFYTTIAYEYDRDTYKNIDKNDMEGGVIKQLKAKKIYPVYNIQFPEVDSLSAAKQVLLIDYTSESPEKEGIKNYLNSNFKEYEKIDFTGVALHVYNREK